MTTNTQRLNVFQLGLALGLTWAIGMLFLGIVAWLFGWGAGMVKVMGDLYIGYSATLMGSIIGAIWGFFDCFIAGILIAWFYNLFSKSK